MILELIMATPIRRAETSLTNVSCRSFRTFKSQWVQCSSVPPKDKYWVRRVLER
jgi:hypothetical protein